MVSLLQLQLEVLRSGHARGGCSDANQHEHYAKHEATNIPSHRLSSYAAASLQPFGQDIGEQMVLGEALG
jgi:hypothetical protein